MTSISSLLDFGRNGIVLDDLTRTCSQAQFAESIEKWRSMYDACGLEPGDCVCLVLTNRIEVIPLIFAGLSTGLTVAPINWHLQKDEILKLTSLSNARLVISESVLMEKLGSHCGCQVINIDKKSDIECSEPKAASDGQSDVAGSIMLFTGGTTGLPKGVIRDAPKDISALITQYQALGQAIGLDGSGPHLVTGPLYHAAPLYYALYDFVNGAPLVIMPRWDPQMALRLIGQRGVKHTHMVPTQMVRLDRLESDVKQRDTVSSVDLILHGAAATSPSVKQHLLEWFGPCFVEYWGGSESGVVTRINSQQWLSKPGSVGKPVPHYEIRIIDAESKELLSSNQTGLIQIKHASSSVPYHYLSNEKAKCEEDVNNGWFDLGDMGYQDQDGYLYIVDRLKNKIICGGVNIYPAEIEQQLLALDGVADAVAFGMKDNDWGELPVAVVQLTDAQRRCEIETFKADVMKRFASVNAFIRPRSIFLMESIDRMPNGKVRIHHIDQWLTNKPWYARIDFK